MSMVRRFIALRRLGICWLLAGLGCGSLRIPADGGRKEAGAETADTAVVEVGALVDRPVAEAGDDTVDAAALDVAPVIDLPVGEASPAEAAPCGQGPCPEGYACVWDDTPPARPMCVPHCMSGRLDGDETDDDCGGSCRACPFLGVCAAATDCQSGECQNGKCAGTCGDGIKSDDETNVDCGGARCPPCALDFAGPPARALGTEPAALVAADFDRDGKLDLAVADRGDAAVLVLLGNGDGTFAAALRFAVGRRPFSVATADFDGDGALDLATTDFDDDAITVLLGQGQGGFASAARLALEAQARPRFVTVADLDEDGRVDLVVSSFLYDSGGTRLGANDVRAFLGDGKGAFAAGARWSAGTNPGTVAVADLDGDGHQDLAVGEASGDGVSVLLGDGQGGMALAARYAAFGWVSSLLAVDLTGDGRLDLAASNYTYYTLSLLASQGGGTFAPVNHYDFSGRSLGIVAADFNHDGIVDIASADVWNGIEVLVGRGAGDFALPALVFPLGATPAALATADFNADGRPDVAVLSASPPSLGIRLALP